MILMTSYGREIETYFTQFKITLLYVLSRFYLLYTKLENKA